MQLKQRIARLERGNTGFGANFADVISRANELRQQIQAGAITAEQAPDTAARLKQNLADFRSKLEVDLARPGPAWAARSKEWDAWRCRDFEIRIMAADGADPVTVELAHDENLAMLKGGPRANPGSFDLAGFLKSL